MDRGRGDGRAPGRRPAAIALPAAGGRASGARVPGGGAVDTGGDRRLARRGRRRAHRPRRSGRGRARPHHPARRTRLRGTRDGARRRNPGRGLQRRVPRARARAAGRVPVRPRVHGGGPRTRRAAPGMPAARRRRRRLPLRPARTAGRGVRHQLPVFGIDVHGSRGGSGSPFCSSSTEIRSGERTNAMWPSRGGRWIVMPIAARCSQVA